MTLRVRLKCNRATGVPVCAENALSERKLAISSFAQHWHVNKAPSDKLLALETLAKLCEVGKLEVKMVALRTLTTICREDTDMRKQVLPPQPLYVNPLTRFPRAPRTRYAMVILLRVSSSMGTRWPSSDRSSNCETL